MVMVCIWCPTNVGGPWGQMGGMDREMKEKVVDVVEGCKKLLTVGKSLI